VSVSRLFSGIHVSSCTKYTKKAAKGCSGKKKTLGTVPNMKEFKGTTQRHQDKTPKINKGKLHQKRKNRGPTSLHIK